jgi:hypothetical protein
VGTWLQRYSTAEAAAEAAWVHWVLGDPNAAAQVLAHPPRPMTADDMRFVVGPRFADVYRTRPADEVKAAVGAMLAAHLEPWHVADLSVPLAKAEAWEQSFAVATSVDAPPGPARELMLRAAEALRHVKGEEAARSWLASQLPQPVPDQAAYDLALLAFRSAADQAIFSLPLPGDAGMAETVWLLRAAALVRLGKHVAESTRSPVLEHYKGSTPGRAFQLGRYLLGDLPEAELPALVTDDSAACEVPFYAGLKARAEGRLDDAAGWLGAAVFCLRPAEAEYLYAWDELRRLREAQ